MDGYVVIDIFDNTCYDERYEIIQLEAIKVKDGGIIGKFSSWVKPIKPVPQYFEWMMCITNDFLKSKPSIIDVWPRFLEFIGDNDIVSDLKFLLKFVNIALEKSNLLLLRSNIIDICDLAKEKCKLENYDLHSIIKALEIDELFESYSHMENVMRVYEKIKSIPNGKIIKSN